MGLQRTIRFPANGGPTWPAIVAAMAERGLPIALRMIDNLPAFPDEVPPEDWKDLRLGFDAGMVTFRRTNATEWSVIIWGNSDPNLVTAWEQCIAAIAESGTGSISE